MYLQRIPRILLVRWIEGQQGLPRLLQVPEKLGQKIKISARLTRCHSQNEDLVPEDIDVGDVGGALRLILPPVEGDP